MVAYFQVKDLPLATKDLFIKMNYITYSIILTFYLHQHFDT